MLCAATLPMLAAGAEMPSYCAGTSPYNSEGNHYGANNYKIMVNGEEELSILLSELTSSTNGITDLTSSKIVDLKAGDELTFNLTGGFHMQWGMCNMYADWNGDGEFSADETYTIFENLEAGDLAAYVSNNAFDFTSTTPIVVPDGIHNGPVALRFVSGEAKMHNSHEYDPCSTTCRGKMVTVTANLNGTAEFAVPQASDYTNLSTLTFSTADGILTAGETVTLPVGTEITVSATAAEGYQVSTITVLDEPVANGGTFVLSGSLSKDDIDIITGQNSYALTVSNDMNFPYTLATTTGEEVNLAQVLEGTDLRLTVTVPEDKVLTGVALGDETLHEVDGAYTFTMPSSAATLAILGREKQLYTITIDQPAVGGTITVNGLKKTDEGFVTGNFASGDKTLEGEVLTLNFERESGYTFVKYVVNGNDFNGTTLTVNENTTISAVTQEGVEYPALTRYYTNGVNQQNRYIKKFTTSGTDTPVVFEATTVDELPFTIYEGPVGTRTESGAIIDKTVNPIVIEEGTENFSYSFTVWENTETVNINGTNVSCGTEIDWTQLAYYVDWNNDGDFTDEKEYVVREQGAMTSGKFKGKTTTKTVIVPEGVKPGIYRMRLVFNEPANSSTNWTLSIWDDGEMRNGVAYDFNISVVPAEFARERTVTIASDNEALGTVAFDEYEGQSVSTKNKNVSFTATPAEGADVINWTNGDDEVVTTTASYTYKGEANASFTAHFGYRLSYGVDGDGSLLASINGESVANGTVLAPGTEVTFTATPDTDRSLQGVTVNGNVVVVDDNGEFTVTVTKATEVKAVFVEALYTITIVTEGNGHCVAGMGYDDEGMPSNEYSSGSQIGKNTDLYFAAVPDEGEKVTSIIATNNGESVTVDADTQNSFDDGLDDWRLANGTICFYTAVEGDITVTVTFTQLSGAIDGVELDGSNGAAEYYNLQGMKIEAKNLVPGMYIVRQGGKTTKQMIEKR